MPNSELQVLREELLLARKSAGAAAEEAAKFKEQVKLAEKEGAAASKNAQDKQHRLDDLKNQTSLLPSLQTRFQAEQAEADRLAAAVKAATVELANRRAAANRLPPILRQQQLMQLMELEKKLKELQVQATAAAQKAANTKQQIDSLSLLLGQIPVAEAEVKAARMAEASTTLKLKQLQQKLSDAQGRIEAEKDAIQRYHDKLEQLLRQLKADLPIALFPVRIETRFVITVDGTDLLVRIYPDDIGQDSLRRELTPIEINWGQAFWQKADEAESEEETKQAWTELAQRFGGERAAWIKEKTKPDGNGPGEPAASAWGSAAKAALLPDRWTVFLYKGEKKAVVARSNPIIDTIATSPSSESGKQLGNSGLFLDEGILWMADFEQAIKIGMALRIRLTTELLSGIDRLVVLGVKVSLNEQESASDLAALMDAHHYTHGLGFIPTGTPSNNTEEVQSGYGEQDTGHWNSFAAEFNTTLVPEANSSLAASAFGIPAATFQHVPYANGVDQIDAKIINHVLWPATWGYFLFQMMDGIEMENDLERWRSWFADYVRARGPLPALRVGNQPYGLLPVTSLDKYRPLFEPDLLMVHLPEGQLQLLSRIGWNVTLDRGVSHWSDQYKIPVNLSSIFSRTTLNSNVRPVLALTAADVMGTGLSDLILFASVQTILGRNEAYQIGWQVNEQGIAKSWSNALTVPNGPAGDVVASAVVCADLNGTGKPDLFILRVTVSRGIRNASYCIGWELDQSGKPASWSNVMSIKIPITSNSVHIAAAIADLDQNGRPELIIVTAPADGSGPAQCQIGWDLTDNGVVSRWTNQQIIPDWPTGQVKGLSINVNQAGVIPEVNVVYLAETDASTVSYLHQLRGFDRVSGAINEWAVRLLANGPANQKGGSLALALADVGRSSRVYLGTASGRANLLSALRSIWRRSLTNVPYYGRTINGNKDLVEMLGMDGVSGSYTVRPVMGPLYTNELWNFMQRPLDDVWWKNHLAAAETGLKLIGLAGKPRLVEMVLENEAAQLQTALVQEGISGKGQVNPNYIAEIAELDPLTLQNSKPYRSLLYLLLKHSMLWEYAGAAIRAGFVKKEQMKEPELVDIPERTTMTPLRLLQKPAPPEPGIKIADYLHKLSYKDPAHQDIAAIAEQREKLQYLAEQSVDVLEELLKESLDLSSHRLDAWITACASERLSELRRKKPQGIYTGGYGWVENLRPSQRSASNGYIHAPSPAHAVTAAILRSGYLAHSGSGNGDLLAVDLSSERVRLALWLLDGIRQGQPMGALLGYRFERGLEERSPGQLNKYIKVLRNLAPLTSNKLIPKTGNVEITAATSVVDGLALLRRWQKGTENGIWDIDTVPFDVLGTMLPARGTSDHAALEEELKKIADLVDALSDLALAESVYQTVQGNPTRTAASLEGLSRGELLPPEPEVVQSARSGIGVTHRVIVMLGDVFTDDKYLQSWDFDEDRQMRAKAEPALNAWAARLFGDPSQVICRVLFEDPKTGTFEEDTITLKQLRLSPLDVLYTAIPQKPEPVFGSQDYRASASEIEQRTLLLAEEMRPGMLVTLLLDRDGSWGADKLSFPELFEIVRSARAVITAARELEHSDLLEPREAVRADVDQANEIDLDDFKKRADQAVTELQNRVQLLGDLTTSHPLLVDLYQALIQLSYCIGDAVPISAGGTVNEKINQLQQQASWLVNDLSQLVDQLTNLEAEFDRDKASRADKVEHDRKRLQAIFGADFRVLPKLKPKNAALLKNSFDDKLGIQEVTPWFQRIAKVRKEVGNLERLLLYAEAASGGRARISFDVAQLPYQPGDKWAGEKSAQGEKLGGQLSLVAHRPSGFNRNDWVSGLVIDEIVEVFPNKRETTAVAFHYDAPGAVAPQAVLLAVAPDVNRPWDENTLEAILLETLELSKLRAVDSAALGDLGQYLPALYFAFNSANETIGMNLYDFSKEKS
ncbi:hypothetical protein BGM25_25165 [Bacillus sp. FJAT-29953]|nr:hypothetical protein [Bacillus sp. FJAT-29953]